MKQWRVYASPRSGFAGISGLWRDWHPAAGHNDSGKTGALAGEVNSVRSRGRRQASAGFAGMGKATAGSHFWSVFHIDILTDSGNTPLSWAPFQPPTSLILSSREIGCG